MWRTATRKISLYAVTTTLIVAVSMVFITPVPATNGFVTLANAGIYIAGLLFGPISGLTVGVLSGGLIDLLSGYPQWFVFSLLIHGGQGWLAGHFSNRNKKMQTLGLLLASFFMISGHVLVTSWLYGVGAGIASSSGNTTQSSFGVIVALPLSQTLKRVLPKNGCLEERGMDK